jgi:hypothetical protein
MLIAVVMECAAKEAGLVWYLAFLPFKLHHQTKEECLIIVSEGLLVISNLRQIYHKGGTGQDRFSGLLSCFCD